MTEEESPPPFSAPEDSQLPPQYERSSTATSATTSRALVERVYTLETSKKKAWALLKVLTRGGKSNSIPSFMQGELITGTVELDLEKTEHIQAVTLEVVGQSLSVGQEPVSFLSHEVTLWSTSMGDPGKPGTGNGSPKLKGHYVWPFSMTLPDTVFTAETKDPTAEYPLPPSFSERASPSYLDYKLLVTFRRGRLRIDNTLSTSFAYLPRTIPPPCSELRRLAYRQNSVPPGIKADPEGWEDIGKKTVTGTVFDSYKVEVTFWFLLAKPLSYTRGTSIPFKLMISSPDKQTTDLFSARGSLSIHLKRTLYIGSDANDEANKGIRTDKTFVINVEQGVYWPSEDDNSNDETRRLDGEIPIRADLKPTFVFPNVTIKYHVFFEPTAPGFTPLLEDGSLPSYCREVEVSTVLAPGPPPKSRVPVKLSKPDAGNYDVSIGVLTAANQRFLHHHGSGFG